MTDYNYLTDYSYNTDDFGYYSSYAAQYSGLAERLSRLQSNFYTLIPSLIYTETNFNNFLDYTDDAWYKSFTRIYTNSDYLAIISMNSDAIPGFVSAASTIDATMTDDSSSGGETVSDIASITTTSSKSGSSSPASGSKTSSKSRSSSSSSSSGTSESSTSSELGGSMMVPMASVLGAIALVLL